MIFPNVKVQPHWLATLKRAAMMMPNCRWVCSALDIGIAPKTEMEVIAAISKAITPCSTVRAWYLHETDSKLQAPQEYRIAWLNHMVEQCRSMQKSD